MEHWIYIIILLAVCGLVILFFKLKKKRYYYDKKSLLSLYKTKINKKKGNQSYNFETASITSVGGRKLNEDSLKYYLGDVSYWLVCDGLGGLNKGEVASNLAVENFEKLFDIKEVFSAEKVGELIKELNKIIIETSLDKKIRMATTCTIVLANNNSILFGYLGDTRFYFFRNNKLIFHTKDHSVVQKYVDMKKMEYKNIRYSPERNILTKVLGIENLCEAEIINNPFKVQNGDKFLICSDGFWEYILENEMEKFLTTSADSLEWLKSMEELLLSRVTNLKNDNYTAIAVFISEK